jgi:hypothetical protein
MRTAAILLLSIVMQAQSQTRDAPATAQVAGTAVISGQVVSEEDPTRPIRLAKVELSTNALRRELMAVTDSNGRFVFSRLPAGRYTLLVSKPGLASTRYGAKRPAGAGVPIVVADGDQVPVTVRIGRGAVIAGTVRDANGEPAAGVRMQVYAYGIDTKGARTLELKTFSNSGNGLLQTDDRGAYRIYGLIPGEYYVQASPTSGGIGGRAISAAEIEWAQRTISSPGGLPAPAPPPGQSMALAPVLFPGTTDAATAVPITLKAGEERTGVDFAVTFIPTATVSGVIRGPDGSPPGLAQGTLLRPGAGVGPGGGSQLVRPNTEGRFTVSDVPPGNYVLAVRGSMQSSPDTVAGPMAVASTPLWAMTDVTVSGRDISGLELTLAPGLNVSGKLIFEGEKPPVGAELTRVSVSLLPQGPTSMGAPSVVAQADGTFVIPGVGPGEYRLSANVPAGTAATSPWSLKSAIISNVDTLDAPFTVRTDVGGAVITFTDRPTELTGSLLDTSGKPALEYFIVVFPADRSLWTAQSRRVRSARPGNTGAFRIAGLPPGDYYVCAMTDLEPNLLNTAAYLEPLVAASIKLNLTEGEKKTQDLKIAR